MWLANISSRGFSASSLQNGRADLMKTHGVSTASNTFHNHTVAVVHRGCNLSLPKLNFKVTSIHRHGIGSNLRLEWWNISEKVIKDIHITIKVRMITHRLIVIFHGHAVLSQTVGNSKGDNRSSGSRNKTSCIGIHWRIIFGNVFQAVILDGPRSSGTRHGNVSFL